MCNISGIIFSTANLTRKDIEGKRVIEIGSRDINGSLRYFIESRDPIEFVGVDIEPGPGVDIICNAEKLIDNFGQNSFDIIIATELLEHIKDWRKVVSNIKNLCKNGGILLITTRSRGFKYHAYPYDYWRYELDDMKMIFSDFLIENIKPDPTAPGVFLKARKPIEFVEKKLSNHNLFSVLVEERVPEINDRTLNTFLKRYCYTTNLRKRIEDALKKIIWFGA